MKVLVAAHYYVPHLGGLEIVAKNQVDQLAENGHEVTVVTSALSQGMQDTRHERVRVVHVPAWHILERFGVPFPIFSPRLFFVMLREASRSDAIHIHDVFYISSWVAYLGAIIFRKPIVLVQHVALVEHPSAVVMLVQRFVYATIGRLIFKRSTYIIVYNEIVREFLTRYGVKPSVIRVIRNGVDTKYFCPVDSVAKKSLRVSYGLPSDRKIALFVGRFVPKKGCDVLFDAHDDRYDIVFVGSGTVPEIWRQTPGVHVLGSRTHKELRELYQLADVFVFPARGEMFTLAMQEAMASGLPIITTDEPAYAASHLNREKMAFVSPESEEIRRAILGITGDIDRAKRMGEYAREVAIEQFDRDTNSSSFLNLYQQLVISGKSDSVQAANNHMRRLMIVTPYFYPKIGGVENYAYNLGRRLSDSGEYEVIVVTTNIESSEYRKEDLNGITVYRLPITKKISNTPINFFWYRDIKKIIAIEKPDIINTHSPVPFMADVTALAAGNTPLVVTYHSGAMAKGRWLVDLVIAVYEIIFLRIFFRRADVIVPVSENFFSTRWGKKFHGKSVLVRPGVDTNVFVPTPLPTNSSIITYVGRVEFNSAWKGLEQLLQAMALVLKKCPSAQLEIVGGGDAVEHYRQRSEDLGISNSVVFAGNKYGKDVVDVYKRSSVVVSSSISDAEQSSVSLIEAMASKRPVIGTNIGGTPFVIENKKNGLLVAPGDVYQLAEAIVKVITISEIAERLAESGVQSAQSVDWHIQINKYRSIFDALLAKKIPISTRGDFTKFAQQK